MPPPHPRTSLLENVALGPEGASLELDGRPVRLDFRAQGDSVAALREFHQGALADYRDRLAQAGRRPAWWARLLGGLGRWLGRAWEGTPAAGSAPAPAAPAAAEPPRPSRPAPEKAAPPPRAPAPRPGRAAAAGPSLRSVCADREGIHFIWRAPGGAGEFHASCPVDSPLGRRLQACYTQLEKLGYKVVSLEGLRPAPAKAPAPEPAAGPIPPTVEKPPAPGPAPAEAPPRLRRRAAPAPEKDAPPPRDPEILPGL